jgi:hypothetical protein
VGVVDVDHPGPGEAGGEQRGLRGEVVVDGLVEVEVILGQVGEDGNVERRASDPAQLTPCSSMAASSACKSAASGVVSALPVTVSPIRVCTPPTRPARWPAARSPDSVR